VLLTRRDSRQLYRLVWAQCREAMNQIPADIRTAVMPRFAVMGNPGIGKSAGLTLALRLALLDGANVVFEARAVGRAFAFVPLGPGRGYEVFSAELVPMGNFASRCARALDPLTVWIVDPSNDPAARRPPSPAKGPIIYACSPSRENFHGLERLEHVFMPCWDYEELVDAAQLLLPGVSEGDLAFRYDALGGTLRYALAKEGLFQSRLVSQAAAAHGIPVERLHQCLNDFTSVAVAPDMGVAAPDKSVAVATDLKAPSQLFRIGLSNPNVKGLNCYTIGNVAMDFISPRATRLIMSSSTQAVKSLLLRYTPTMATSVGRLFEDVALAIIKRNARPMVAVALGAEPPGPRELEVFPARQQVELVYTGNLVARLPDALSRPGRLLVPVSPNFPSVDAVAVPSAGALVGLQVTLASDHPVGLGGCRDIHDALHSFELAQRKPGTRSDSFVTPPFPLVFVVPWFRAKEFSEQKLEGQAPEHPCLKQYLLVISEEDFVGYLSTVPADRSPAESAEDVSRSRKRPRAD
jgi:hypothetical protein